MYRRFSLYKFVPTSSGDDPGVLFQIQSSTSVAIGILSFRKTCLQVSAFHADVLTPIQILSSHFSPKTLPSSQISIKLFLSPSACLVFFTIRSGNSGFLQSQQLSPTSGTRLARSC